MNYKKFTKKQRGTFRYWFWHWLAFNNTAIKYKCWKFKYLFHDIEKPFLMLWFHGDYEKVQKFHRYHNRHHLQYYDPKKIDYEGLCIDWECSGLTKLAAQRNLIQEIEVKFKSKEISYDTALEILVIGSKLNILDQLDVNGFYSLLRSQKYIINEDKNCICC